MVLNIGLPERGILKIEVPWPFFETALGRSGLIRFPPAKNADFRPFLTTPLPRRLGRYLILKSGGSASAAASSQAHEPSMTESKELL